jgi:sodium/bile acid cotransporter 7
LNIFIENSSSGGSLGAIVLPVMIYHQIQLIVCGVIAQRYAKETR